MRTIYLQLYDKYKKKNKHYHVYFSDVWLHSSVQKISSVILLKIRLGELYLMKFLKNMNFLNF